MYSYLMVLALTAFSLVSGTCPNTLWKSFGSNCYYSVAGKVNYANAKQSCQSIGNNAHLVTILSAQEQNFLNTNYPNKKYWLGLEAVGSAWRWIDNSPFSYENWAGTQIMTNCPMANYASNNGRWTTVTCGLKNIADLTVICEMSSSTATTTTTAAPVTTCTDRALPGKPSECPGLATYCSRPGYEDFMASECPLTCNRCPSSACVDKLMPDNTTDCPAKAFLCNDTVYFDYMTENCPKTCNRCPVQTLCADKPSVDGTPTDCPAKVGLCQNPDYVDYMKIQCPKTCNYCT